MVRLGGCNPPRTHGELFGLDPRAKRETRSCTARA